LLSVSDRVNRVVNDGEECSAPVELKVQSQRVLFS